MHLNTSYIKKISLIIPVFNEVVALEDFHFRNLAPVLQNIKFNFEIVYVDDGSSDDSLKILHEIARKDQRIKVLALSKNFGKEVALIAGLSEATGEAAIMLDSDGQHPPELIGSFIEIWQNGAQIVSGVRASNRSETFVKSVGSKIFYKLFNFISDVKLESGSTDFRLVDREVIDSLLLLKQKTRITRGLIEWLGYAPKYIEFEAPPRLGGEATYSVKKLVQLAFDSVFTMSLKPLRLFGWIGIFLSLLSSLAGLFVLIEQYLMNDPLDLNISGTAGISILITFFIGLVLMSQTIIGTYIGYIYEESQGKPLFVVNKKHSFNIKK